MFTTYLLLTTWYADRRTINCVSHVACIPRRFPTIDRLRGPRGLFLISHAGRCLFSFLFVSLFLFFFGPPVLGQADYTRSRFSARAKCTCSCRFCISYIVLHLEIRCNVHCVLRTLQWCTDTEFVPTYWLCCTTCVRHCIFRVGWITFKK